MKEYIERMKAELAELTTRKTELGAFIKTNPLFSTLSVGEQLDQLDQLQAMVLYVRSLTYRVERADRD